jgi:hypothetical protein
MQAMINVFIILLPNIAATYQETPSREICDRSDFRSQTDIGNIIEQKHSPHDLT